MSRRARKLLIVALAIVALLIALPAWLFADALVCGPVTRTLLPKKTGGPHYYESFNHLCTPWHPVGEAPAGARPNATTSLVEAFFDAKGRVIKLSKYEAGGKLFWRHEITYDDNGWVKTLVHGQVGDAWKRSEYDRWTLVREVPVPAPADLVWQPPK